MPDASICEIVRKQELEYTSGSVKTSKYVDFSMYDTICKIEAYLNSKHTTGETDSLGREKPFFNITVAAANIWMRATDIDRKNIKVRATKSKDWIDSFLANIHLHDWMRREDYGTYLNEWGRVLARYGSAVTKFVKNSSGLHINVVSWSRLICDPVDFDANPKIEPIELTEGQLWGRVQTHGYNTTAVEGLMDAITTRETLDRQRKDNRTGYIRIYEVHALLSVAQLKKAKGEEPGEGDTTRFVQQMEVVAFVGTKSGRKTEYEDFVLYAGQEDSDPYEKDDLIREDDRTLAIGAVEHLFDAQWMTNHAIKNEKDTLDLASRLVFQTADANFLNMNVLDNIETGDILIHAVNMPLTQINTAKSDIVGVMNFRQAWRQVGNEINGISDAMLGIRPHSGTSARFAQTLLQESYSLFELMTENKGLAIERQMRNRILPYIKETKMKTSEEIAATLEDHDITRIDGIFLKNEAIKKTNKQVMDAITANLDRIARKEPVQPIDAGGMFNQNMQNLQNSMALLGSTRYFKPSDLDTATWEEQFKDLVWEVEVDITGENSDTQEALQTLNTALQTVVAPGFAGNKKAQAIVGRILELTGTMSPVEYASIPDSPAPTDTQTPTLPPTETAPGNGLPNK